MRPTSVIQRVRQIMAEGRGGIPQDGPAIAAAYGELCRKSNERLRSCADYLKKGMVSEALRIAETEPPLLDLCGEIDFVGVEEWGGLCGQRKWAAPEAIDGKAIQILNEAYSSNQALEPLLKEYRRAVLEKRTRECVRLLRRIAELDKVNPNWLQDLHAFEGRRMSEIREELDAARSTDDIDALAALMVEINGTWGIPRDDQLRKEIREVAVGVYAKQALAEGTHVLGGLAAAYAALDFDRVAEAVQVYQSLLGAGYLKPTAAMQTQFEEALEWYQQEKKRRDDDRIHEETLGKLRSAVENGEGGHIEELLGILARFERPIPDRLNERASALMSAHQLARERVRRRWIATASVFLILAGVGLAAAITYLKTQKAMRELNADLERAFEGENLAAFRGLMSKAEQQQKRVFLTPTIQTWVSKLRELEALVEKKNAAYIAAVIRLESLREGRFQEDAAAVDALITEAKANLTAGAEEGRLATIVREWEASKQSLAQELAKQISGTLDEIAAALDRIGGDRSLVAEAAKRQFEEEKDKAAALESSFQGRLSAEHRARLAALVAQCDAATTEIAGKEKQMSVIAGGKTLSAYFGAMQTYTRAFPADGMKELMEAVLAREEIYRKILEAPAGCSSNNPFWHQANAERTDAAARAAEKWPEMRTQLMELEQDKRLADLWQFRSAKGVVISEGRPLWGSSAASRMKYYIVRPDDMQPGFTEMTVYANDASHAVLMPHCEFVKGIVSMARFSTPLQAADDLMNKMRELYEVKDISPLLKLRLMDVLADCCAGLTGDGQLARWPALQRDLKSIDPSLHWLCTEHRDVKTANERAKVILDRYFSDDSMIRQIRFCREVRDVSLRRALRWVGCVSLTNSATVTWREGSLPTEVWVARLGEAGSPQIVLAAETTPNGAQQYMKYIPGEPLFAPTGDKSTRDYLIGLKSKYAMTKTKQLKWPNSWPVNLRE